MSRSQKNPFFKNTVRKIFDLKHRREAPILIFFSCTRVLIRLFKLILVLEIIVVDPWQLGTDTDPNPRIRTTDIRIRLHILILLFSAVADKRGEKYVLFWQSFFAY